MEENNNAIEQFYIKNRLPKDIETLPYEIMSEDNQRIIDKIKNDEDLTSEELETIKQTIADYSDTLKKYDANQIIESNKILDETIATEKELLDLVYNQEKIVLKMNIPVNGTEKLFKFTVKPLTDSRAVQMLDAHIDIFRGLSNEERTVYQKNINGNSLNEKEKAVLEHINKKIEENRTRSQIEEVANFLAYQIEEPRSLSIEEKIEYWSNFNFIYRMALYNKVTEKLGLNSDFNEKLFQD